MVDRRISKHLLEKENESTPLIASKPNQSDDSIQSGNGHNRILFFSSSVMLLGALCTGTMLGLSSPLIPSIENDAHSNAIPIGKSEASWIGSLVMLGGIFGGFIAGFMMQSLGRRFTAILSAVPYLAGLLLISFAVNVWMIYAGRFITGIGVAVTSLVVPTYVGEISTQRLRGRLGAGNQLFIVIGIFLVYALGGVLEWRWLALVMGVIPVLYAILCLFIPETPRHLYLKNQRRESTSALQFLRGQEADIEAEIRELAASMLLNKSEVSWKDVFVTPAIRKPLALAVVSMLCQQFSGINCIMFYSKNIFQNAGFKSQSQSQMALLLVAGIQIFFTFVSCLLIDRTGRRILLAISSAVMAISMVTFGLYFQLTSNSSGSSNDLTWLALASMMVYISAFSIGLGPIPWIIMMELIPVRAKGKCGGIVTAINLLSAFIITKEFYDMQLAFTPQATFWIFGGVCFLSMLFAIFLLPETKGKSLEEIERLFDKRVIANYESIEKHDVANYESIENPSFE